MRVKFFATFGGWERIYGVSKYTVTATDALMSAGDRGFYGVLC